MRYNGGSFVKKTGEHTGKINKYHFNNLARFFKDSGYMDLAHSYSAPVTDNPTTYTTVVMNGKRKIILNYGDAVPIKLWAIEQLIDKLMMDAKWDDEKTD